MCKEAVYGTLQQTLQGNKIGKCEARHFRHKYFPDFT